MGEYAEMMLDGTCCEACGEFIGNPIGHPRYCCKACEPRSHSSPVKSRKMANQLPVAPTTAKPFPCSTCNRAFRTESALRDHSRDRHDRTDEVTAHG